MTRIFIPLALALFFGAPGYVKAEDVSRFVRLVRGPSREPTALETSIARYRLPGDVEISLVAAVHVGEGRYYESLNNVFRGFDAVLYELITDAEAGRPEKGEHGANPVSMLQRAVRDVLQLRFQLEAIDYRAPNFVHADMTLDEFNRSMERRGESFLQLFLRALSASQMEPGKGPAPIDLNNLLLLAFSQSRALALRRIMAEQLKDMGDVLDAINGPEGSTIISERNRRAMDILEKQIKLGKRRLAIFYGGAHMPDMERQLHSRFGAEDDGQTWLVAWSLGA